jgi:hypothetical protein
MSGIILVLLAFQPGCPDPITLYASGVEEGWTEEDETQIPISQTRCREIFGENYCLYKLTKLGTSRYTAICRKKEE